MKKIINKIVVILLAFLITFAPVSASFPNVINVEAHSGRTDSSGGHRDNKNKSGLGSYHYHCGGHPAHLHKDGICPYSTNNSPANNKNSKSIRSSKTRSNSTVSDDTVKKVQSALNELGYDCGKADGVFGKKLKAALKKFQEDNGIKVDGKIGKQVKKALKITE